MSPVDVRTLAVCAELERDWAEVERQLERAAQVDPGGSGPDAAWVALALDHAYQALEQILLRVERALGLPIRAGDAWHRALLADAARPLPGVRPAIVPSEVETDWEQLLGFRHFLRHAYAAELDAERLRRNLERLRRAVAATAPTLRAAIDALRAQE